jgi:putative two-component system response regulator
VKNVKKRLLFVDDEPNCLRSIERMLRGQRQVWEMQFVSGVREALEAVGANDFDVVISDVAMPGRDGFDLLGELRESEKTKDLPVVMLTGLGDDDLKCLALNQGATDLLAKPVSLEDLKARIRSVLRLKSCQDELRQLNDTLQQKVTERTRELENSHIDILWRLAKAGEYRDEATGDHIARVGCYSRLLAKKMNLPETFVETIFLTAPLHDIGKIGIPDSILLKPGKLSPPERNLMQKHCAIGAEILRQEPRGQRLLMKLIGNESYLPWSGKDNRLLDMAVSVAMGHHERWDGRGYPARRAGDDIPVEAQIVALADVYDALCSSRPYRPAFPERKALAIMKTQSKGQFSPRVYHAFENLVKSFRSVRAAFAAEMNLEDVLSARR